MKQEHPYAIYLLLIRHGETASNKEHRYLGRTDEALSEEGSQKILEKWAGCPAPDLLLISPMKRCRQTAEIIWPAQNIPTWEVPAWREMDFGRFEGKNYRELNGDPDYQAWIDSGGTLPFPEGESREEFINRCMQGWTQARSILKEFCLKSQTSAQYQTRTRPENQETPVLEAAAVVHGGTIMSIMSSLTGKDYFDFQIKNAEALELDLRPKGMDYELYRYVPYGSVRGRFSAGHDSGGSLLPSPSDPADRVADRDAGEEME